MRQMFLLCLILAAGAGGWYYWQMQNKQSSGPAQQLTQINTAKVERGPIVLLVAATGRVVANLDVDIKCKASGEIMRLPYEVSDSVAKDDLLVELNQIDELRVVRQSEVELSASEARLAQAKISLVVAQRNLVINKKRSQINLTAIEAKAGDSAAKAERLKQLLSQKLTGEEEAETARVAAIQANADLQNARLRLEELAIEEAMLELKHQDMRLAETKVETDKINLSQAQQRLKDTKVMAPISGVITARNVQIGQIISSGISNVGGGTTVLTLSDLSHMFILASVDESDIGKIDVGQAVDITADAFARARFRGKVVRMATKGVNSSNVVTFEVKIEVVSDNKTLLKPEMTANVEIITAKKDDVLIVPTTAISRKQGKRFVMVLKDPKDPKDPKEPQVQEERLVEVGINDGLRCEIISGLTVGESVVVRKEDSESRWRRDPTMSPRMMFGGSGRRW